jgi:predicted double-glycine peptidase
MQNTKPYIHNKRPVQEESKQKMSKSHDSRVWDKYKYVCILKGYAQHRNKFTTKDDLSKIT